MGEVAKAVCGPTGEELRVQHVHAPKQRLAKGEVRREGVVAGENNGSDVKYAQLLLSAMEGDE